MNPTRWGCSSTNFCFLGPHIKKTSWRLQSYFMTPFFLSFLGPYIWNKQLMEVKIPSIYRFICCVTPTAPPSSMEDASCWRWQFHTSRRPRLVDKNSPGIWVYSERRDMAVLHNTASICLNPSFTDKFIYIYITYLLSSEPVVQFLDGSQHHHFGHRGSSWGYSWV